MDEFEGRVAVVTGAASGIGLATATRFAQEGMRVVLSHIERDRVSVRVFALESSLDELVSAFEVSRRALRSGNRQACLGPGKCASRGRPPRALALPTP
jgi:NAD(P)-dependent dehydrogenase (short-subunit alcohol dehydrogenase family)